MQNAEQNQGIPYKSHEIEGQCILHRIFPVVLNQIKNGFYIFFCILLVGFPLLLIYWFPSLERLLYDNSELNKATHFIIINYNEEMTICQKQVGELFTTVNQSNNYTYFTNKYLKYVITNNSDGVCVSALAFSSNDRIGSLMAKKDDEGKGLRDDQVQNLRRSYGSGTMMIEQPSLVILVIKEIFRPLILFLVFAIIFLCAALAYYYYPGVIFVTMVITSILTIRQLIELNRNIREMAYYEVKIHCLRNGNVQEVSSINIVPGDIVFLKSSIKLPFDAVILEGSALINECALTGESVPVVKKGDLLDNYSSPFYAIHKNSEIYEGTTIIQLNCNQKMKRFEDQREAFGIPVCVTRTNFMTLRGQLVRIILFPKEQENRFQRESGKFLLVLFVVALITFFGGLSFLASIVDPLTVFIYFLGIITIAVPPALPISMSIGILYALEKLKSKKIFCLDESKIITGGMINFSCFDKTGTLTEDFMNFHSIISANEGEFISLLRPQDSNKLAAIPPEKNYLNRILGNMASNHSIIKIEATGQLVGDPMEIKLFQFGKCTLNQDNSNSNILFSYDSENQKGDVYWRFQFDSDLQRMSVICKHKSDEDFYVYCKGSPEIMMNIMVKQSIPKNYLLELKKYTSKGLRVLAICHKHLKSDIFQRSQTDGNDKVNLNRSQMESDLIFDGFEIFQNMLKAETTSAIQELKEAAIGLVMITGDNALTGSNIAYKCGIVDAEKKLLVCDYKINDGKFHCEEFVYEKQQSQNFKQFNQISFLQNQHQQQHQVELHQLGQISSADQIKNKEYLLQQQRLKKLITANSFTDNQEFIRDITKFVSFTHFQLCITGSVFNQLFSGKIEEIDEERKRLISFCRVFARTKPNDKAKIVMVLQHVGHTVSMCGDGANDCGALKQADIGLSLSPAEASISAPFTSQVTNISSMVELIKQCRSGLATNFSLFNIMVSYSLLEYTNTVILEIYYVFTPQFQFMYWDLICNFLFILLLGYTGTAEKLSKEKPSNSLFCVTNIAQVLIVFGIQILGQICMILAYSGAWAEQTGYYDIGGRDVNGQLYTFYGAFNLDTPESNILFYFVNFIFLFSVVGFSIGRPWKKQIYTNIPVVIVFILALTYTIVIIFVPDARLTKFYLTTLTDTSLLGFTCGMGLLFGIFIVCLLKFIMEPLTYYLKNKYPDKKWL